MTAINKPMPTLYEWAGGMPAFENLFNKFYDKVLADDILEPVFKHMSIQHRLHVAHFVARHLWLIWNGARA
jgi:hemoglobin